jgi:L-malate glycosyltransferase
MTVLEAFAVGIPVVATKVGEIPHVIDHGANGFIGDLDAPTEAFVGLLRQLICPARRESMGNVARQKVSDHFQEQTMLQQYPTIIDQLC